MLWRWNSLDIWSSPCIPLQKHAHAGSEVRFHVRFLSLPHADRGNIYIRRPDSQSLPWICMISFFLIVVEFRSELRRYDVGSAVKGRVPGCSKSYGLWKNRCNAEIATPWSPSLHSYNRHAKSAYWICSIHHLADFYQASFEIAVVDTFFNGKIRILIRSWFVLSSGDFEKRFKQG